MKQASESSAPKASEQQSTGTDKSSTKHISRWLKSQRTTAEGKLSLAIALGSGNGLLMILQTAILAYVIDASIFSELLSSPDPLLLSTAEVASNVLGLGSLQWMLLALAAIILLRAALGYYSECYSRRGAMLIKAGIRQQLLKRLFQQGPAYVQAQGSAKLAQTLHQGVDALEDYFAGYLPVVAYCSVIPLAILIAVLPIDWQSGLILLFTAPMVPFFMILIGHKAQQLNQQHWSALLRMSGHFLDIIQGLTQLKIFNASRREIAAVKKISDDFGDRTMGILRVAFLSSFMLEFLASISIALVAVVLGFRLYYGDVDYLLALWVLLLAPEFYLPFRQLGTQYHAKMAGVSAAEKIVEILQQPQPGPSVNKQFKGPFQLQLGQLNFSYPGRSAALSDINLQFSGTGLYALIGESGAGKSTLVDLLLGFINPSRGSVRINGSELTADNRDAWLQHCGWIAQQGHIFYGSLGFNVAMQEQYDTAAVLAALHKAGLSDFVCSLKNGICSQVGEDGVGLSGGQAQRLALARAFYHQPSVLILDEPTSHLDKDTEQIIARSIALYAEDHLVIVIAHRLHTVVDAKQIIVLQEGKILETGNHQQLLQADGYYAQLLSPTEQHRMQEAPETALHYSWQAEELTQ